MGYIAHDAVVVTASLDLPGHPDVEAFRAQIPHPVRSLLIGPIPGIVNHYATWVFAPDGSKEYWDESDECDVWRKRFIDLWTDHRASLVHVRFGADYGADNGATVEDATDDAQVSRSMTGL